MRKIAFVAVAAVLISGIAYAAVTLFSKQHSTGASCQDLVDQLKEERLDASLERWFYEHRAEWEASEDRPLPRIPLGKVDRPEFCRHSVAALRVAPFKLYR